MATARRQWRATLTTLTPTTTTTLTHATTTMPQENNTTENVRWGG